VNPRLYLAEASIPGLVWNERATLTLTIGQEICDKSNCRWTVLDPNAITVQRGLGIAGVRRKTITRAQFNNRSW
jgi:hypothetical protein